MSPHGLRKAMCRRLAEAGCSASQIAAISGHKTFERFSGTPKPRIRRNGYRCDGCHRTKAVFNWKTAVSGWKTPPQVIENTWEQTDAYNPGEVIDPNEGNQIPGQRRDEQAEATEQGGDDLGRDDRSEEGWRAPGWVGAKRPLSCA